MELTFGDGEGLGQRKRTRRELFLEEMEQAVSWKGLLALDSTKVTPGPKNGGRSRVLSDALEQLLDYTTWGGLQNCFDPI
jgi:IS5 family transposase